MLFPRQTLPLKLMCSSSNSNFFASRKKMTREEKEEETGSSWLAQGKNFVSRSYSILCCYIELENGNHHMYKISSFNTYLTFKMFIKIVIVVQHSYLVGLPCRPVRLRLGITRRLHRGLLAWDLWRASGSKYQWQGVYIVNAAVLWSKHKKIL